MKKRLALLVALIFFTGVVFVSCAGMETKPTASDFKTPVIKGEYFEVPQYDGFWHYDAKAAPVKGAKGNHGAPLPLSFLLSVTNPNSFPILLEGVTFTVAFDNDFELYTGNNSDSYWIPAGKTSNVRLNTMITTMSAFMSVGVTGGDNLKKRGWAIWDAIERWWVGVPEMKVPVTLKECNFTFKADGITKVVPFQTTFK
jgi:LEA14-like dessication related protein